LPTRGAEGVPNGNTAVQAFVSVTQLGGQGSFRIVTDGSFTASVIDGASSPAFRL
jgi:hypothetical protein